MQNFHAKYKIIPWPFLFWSKIVSLFRCRAQTLLLLLKTSNDWKLKTKSQGCKKCGFLAIFNRYSLLQACSKPPPAEPCYKLVRDPNFSPKEDEPKKRDLPELVPIPELKKPSFHIEGVQIVATSLTNSSPLNSSLTGSNQSPVSVNTGGYFLAKVNLRFSLEPFFLEVFHWLNRFQIWPFGVILQNLTPGFRHEIAFNMQVNMTPY